MKLLTTTQQRTISPLPISNATKYKSDSNPNLQLTPVTSVCSIHTSHNIIGHNILTVDIFNKELLKDVFNLAESLRNAVRKERPLDHILRVRTNAKYRMIILSILSIFLQLNKSVNVHSQLSLLI